MPGLPHYILFVPSPNPSSHNLRGYLTQYFFPPDWDWGRHIILGFDKNGDSFINKKT
jgi:hypothetical protein